MSGARDPEPPSPAPAAETLPDFFWRAPPIRLRDPLAAFLGSAGGGVLAYRYADAVRLSGHSCPTVASAWLMTRAALAALYPVGLPERGGVAVRLREAADAGVTGVTGVVARVVSLVTGAAGDDGFKGIAGRFVRCGLLRFGAAIEGELRFTRVDDGHAVELSARLDRVPADPALRPALQRALSDPGDEGAQAAFASLWQERVQRLLSHADDPAVIVVRPVAPAG